MASDIVGLCNQFTEKWAEAFALRENAVVSGPGAYLPMLALLAGADGPALGRLENALQVPKQYAAETLRTLHQTMTSAADTELATGLWSTPEFGLKPAYQASIQPIPCYPFPASQQEIDDWVRTHTDGHMEVFPFEIENIEEIFWASIVHCKAPWIIPFQEGPGDWHSVPEHTDWVHNVRPSRADVSLLTLGEDRFSRLTCQTQGGFDVHLLAGDADARPGQVLSAGIQALNNADMITEGYDLTEDQSGGVINWRLCQSEDPCATELRIAVPAFDMADFRWFRHDAEVIPEWRDIMPNYTHLPDMSDHEIKEFDLMQAARATFGATGFSASAVAEVMHWLGGIYDPKPGEYWALELTFDRPFGFLVVDRESNLVTFAGWHGQF